MIKLDEKTFGQRLGRYSLTKRQINKIKGWELKYYENDLWGKSLGFFKTITEAKEFIINHNNTQG